MRDDACPTHRKPDATNDVLEARVGANVVSGGINTQIGDVLALRRTLSRALAVPSPCFPVVRDADLSNRLVSKVDSPQKSPIPRSKPNAVE
jgi:hypothetical protein